MLPYFTPVASYLLNFFRFPCRIQSRYVLQAFVDLPSAQVLWQILDKQRAHVRVEGKLWRLQMATLDFWCIGEVQLLQFHYPQVDIYIYIITIQL